STYDYTSPSSVNLASTYGDDVTVGTINNSPDGVQIYRVDSAPNVTTPPAGLDQLSQSHYFGVFVVGGSSPTYTLTYNYEGHPGISNEDNLELVSRSNNATASWTDLNATLDTGANTLIKTGQTGTQYILGSASDNLLPVNLSSFYAIYIGGTPTLYWTTQSEENNDYWNVYRGTNQNFETAAQINAEPVPGNGTTNNASDYIYVDTVPVVQNTTYWYWIEDVSTDGETEVHEPITLSIPYEDTPVTPENYGLHQNYPNPFNPSTSISFTLAEDSEVELIIYNIKGEKVRSIYNSFVYAEQVETVVWDGNDKNGKQVSSGVYYYKLITETKEYQRKMLLVK
ncbi:MAG: FlgD immunoglobulin-like domain containing protein, partial [Candidatus Cloacimonadota bacterium]|nr:FlgD immunoglobulin-like domain containing protein [Candidatus Cloacimonadota bacterium]